MSTALYRRYRSATFGELIGQNHLATTLRNQVRDGGVAHAYLFSGMRGTGKTSTARILARAVNCTDLRDGEPCNQCVACTDITSGSTVDVLEIDAASNRGIDEMRDLREKVKFLPAALRRKVYIIDEAHMLTNEAWNALLKTLEEPPDHVLFILATTEPHKIPETVRSRVQRFDFRRVDGAAVAGHLTTIAATEGLTLDEEAASLLSRASQGSVRDALSLLEQTTASASDGRVTVKDVRAALGYADAQVMEQLVQGLAGGNAGAALDAVNQALEGGADPRQLLRDTARLARATSLACIGYQDKGDLDAADRAVVTALVGLRGDVRWWLDGLDRIAATELALRQPVDARLQVEQCFLQMACHMPSAASVTATPVRAAPRVSAPVPAPVAAPAVTPPAPPALEPESEPKAAPSVVQAPQPPAPPSGDINNVEDWVSAWPRLIEAVNKRKEISLAGVLRDCRPLECDNEQLTIGALYAFHLERLQDAAKLAVLTEAVAEIGGRPRVVKAVFSGKTDTAKKAENAASGQDFTEAVLETFAGSRITGSRIRDRDRDN